MKQVIFGAIVSAIFFCSPALSQEAKYVKIGNYFKVGSDKFRLKGVRDVKGLGTYGRVTGRGVTGAITPNGFESNGGLGRIAAFDAIVATASGKIISKAAASGGGDISAIKGLKPITGTLNLEFNERSNYSVVVVSPSNWEDVYRRLTDKYNSGDSGLRKRFQDKHFRVIDSVVFATNFEIERTTNISGEFDGNGSTSKLTLSANLSGSSNIERTFVLTGEQIIAYSFRRLCWSNGEIVGARIDNPREIDDNIGCKKY